MTQTTNTKITAFPPEVQQELQHYVYRLIDPRNGETFYVGKGQGNRVFSHAKGEISKDEDALSEKLRRINEIKIAGLQVAHIIHRYGMDKNTADQVESALIDAYPATTNIAGGKDSGDKGIMHVKEIITKYAAEEAVFQHRMIAITVNRTAYDLGLYKAVRYAWRLNKKRADKAEYIIAIINGLIVGVYKPDGPWLDATRENFPDLPYDIPERFGFYGKEANAEIKALYIDKRVPAEMRKPGAANPIRYIDPQKPEDI